MIPQFPDLSSAPLHAQRALAEPTNNDGGNDGYQSQDSGDNDDDSCGGDGSTDDDNGGDDNNDSDSDDPLAGLMDDDDEDDPAEEAGRRRSMFPVHTNSAIQDEAASEQAQETNPDGTLSALAKSLLAKTRPDISSQNASAPAAGGRRRWAAKPRQKSRQRQLAHQHEGQSEQGESSQISGADNPSTTENDSDDSSDSSSSDDEYDRMAADIEAESRLSAVPEDSEEQSQDSGDTEDDDDDDTVDNGVDGEGGDGDLSDKWKTVRLLETLPYSLAQTCPTSLVHMLSTEIGKVAA